MNETLALRADPRLQSEPDLELTILMPCLNEAETIARCVSKALAYLAASKVSGEVLISDNGSTDGSQEIATKLGARVVPAPERGYGAALLSGIANARGKYIIMGDADDSYDFSKLDLFVEKLRAGNDLVMGNRFEGGIEPGAMPFLHKWLGNPVLSYIGRRFFWIEIGDFHCGLRGFNTARMRSLNLNAKGMEFASEMIVRSALARYSIAEVPTTLKKDGRSRPPHLRTWRDGWRHLRFLLLFSPRWLFFYPGIALFLIGAVISLALLPGPIAITRNVTLDVHTFVVGSIMMLIGAQCISFAVVARRYAAMRGFLPLSSRVEWALRTLSLERMLVVAGLIGLAGFIGLCWCVGQWAAEDFGPLQYGSMIKGLTFSVSGMAVALQLAFTSFLASFLEIEV